MGGALRAVAAEPGRRTSPVCREADRYGGRESCRAAAAEEAARERAGRPKPCLLALNADLRGIVAAKFADGRSPRRIAGHLRADYGGREGTRSSREVIHIRGPRPNRRRRHAVVARDDPQEPVPRAPWRVEKEPVAG